MDTGGKRLYQHIDLLKQYQDADALHKAHPPKEGAKKIHLQGGVFLSRSPPDSREVSTAAACPSLLVFVLLEEGRVLQRFSITSDRFKGGQFTLDQRPGHFL